MWRDRKIEEEIQAFNHIQNLYLTNGDLEDRRLMMPCGSIRPVPEISLLRVPFGGYDCITGMAPKEELPAALAFTDEWSPWIWKKCLQWPIDAISTGIQMEWRKIKANTISGFLYSQVKT